jgi:hypothetical protein
MWVKSADRFEQCAANETGGMHGTAVGRELVFEQSHEGQSMTLGASRGDKGPHAEHVGVA